jgi:hypothetical protein
MPNKKLLQDIIPVKINKIHSSISTPASVAASKFSQHEHEHQQNRAAFHHFQKPKKRRKEKWQKNIRDPRRRKIWLIILLAIACIVIIFIAMTYVYAKAVVIITPKTEQVAVSGTYIAVKNGSVGAESVATGTLPYEVIETSEIASTTVTASQGPLIQNKAWGLVILYNTYSTTAQKLLVGTRLTNDKGLIYKTAETVTIPGIHKTPTSTNPNATSTGSVSVYVVADQPGSQYNIAPTDLTGDFKVVAFQGEPKYTSIYGRLKPKGAVIGGYSGYQTAVATSTLEQAQASLSPSVNSALTSDLKALVPEGYVVYQGAYSIRLASTTISKVSSTTDSTSNSTTASANAIVSLKGSLYGIMFKESDLVKAIAPAQVAEFPPSDFIINNLESLTFTPTNPVAFQNILNSESQSNAQNSGLISFTLSGSFGMVGTFPSATIAQALAGLSVAQSKDVFAKYSTIMTAHAIISPFWKHSFPDSANKIIIDIQQ